MLSAWKLKNLVEVHELSKNLFLFCFATKRDLEGFLNNGPWSFDWNLLVLSRVSTMAKKLGGVLGKFEELDSKEAHRNGRFLRIKVNIDLKKPLKIGTMVRFKEKILRVHFKYECLPTFCFICERVGHQLKDCKPVGDLSKEGFEVLEEQDLAFGACLRASPLPRIQEDHRKKEFNSSLCRKSLFNLLQDKAVVRLRGKGRKVKKAKLIKERKLGRGLKEKRPHNLLGKTRVGRL
ncbi:unnamed protein product [Lathyrus sativus]|nr:unnamed protein product [Lathyrus sativus]